MAQKNIIKRIISSPLVQTLLIYISGGWIVLEMTDYFINKYDLNERISDVLSIILLIGLPVAIFLAWYLSREKEERVEIASDSVVNKKSMRFFNYLSKKPWFSIPGMILLIIFLVTGIKYFHRQHKIKWATEIAISKIEEYAFNEQYTEAYQHIKKGPKIYP